MDYRLVGLCFFLWLLLPWLGTQLLRRWGHLQTNFQGQRIPQSLGVVMLVQLLLLWGFLSWIWPTQYREFLLWALLCSGFGLLGLVDDLWGTAESRGFRGHVRALVQQHRLTTGLVKAIGGGLFGIGLCYWSDLSHPVRAVLGGIVIALSANMVNLLDLRPGRAIAVFTVMALLLLLQEAHPFHHPLFFLILCALSLWGYDALGKAMLGDVGSNLLGAALGFEALHILPLWGVVVALLLLCALQTVAEQVSLSKMIEQNRILRFLDRLTGIR